ncbi:hypothetical protein GC207_06680 [bacterium]|nr:hypothetical protein [bacterium]
MRHLNFLCQSFIGRPINQLIGLSCLMVVMAGCVYEGSYSSMYITRYVNVGAAPSNTSNPNALKSVVSNALIQAGLTVANLPSERPYKAVTHWQIAHAGVLTVREYKGDGLLLLFSGSDSPRRIDQVKESETRVLQRLRTNGSLRVTKARFVNVHPGQTTLVEEQ